jgi:hypothetical protein
MARPAGSSRALLMRRPEDRRAVVVCKAASVVIQYRRAVTAIMFVFRDSKGNSAMTQSRPFGHNFLCQLGKV